MAEVEESDGSVTSSDIPLAQSTKKNSKGKGKAKAKATEMVSEEEEVEEIEVPLPERFEKMIRDDRDLYLRMLRYEVSAVVPCEKDKAYEQPISFDELISKAIANKISGKGWKDQLKRFLDLQVRTTIAFTRHVLIAGHHILYRRPHGSTASTLTKHSRPVDCNHTHTLLQLYAIVHPQRLLPNSCIW